MGDSELAGVAPYTNISAYQFKHVDAKALPDMRLCLRKKARDLGLKGTILLSTEGINLFISGPVATVETMVVAIKAYGFSFEPKHSPSYTQPFKRMLVKIKKEIIAMGCAEIKPMEKKAPYTTPQTLKRWLDQGEPVVLLDTRNDYELRIGAFKNAKILPLQSFRDFPQQVQALKGIDKKQKIVTYCTGGIRCEKAAQYMLDQGYEHVTQLEGGILKYFELCGQDHYTGECFVFDRRVSVDATLAPTKTVQCYACRQPLDHAQQLAIAPEFMCPYCQDYIGHRPSLPGLHVVSAESSGVSDQGDSL
jgi:UPF0176 protein